MNKCIIKHAQTIALFILILLPLCSCAGEPAAGGKSYDEKVIVYEKEIVSRLTMRLESDDWFTRMSTIYDIGAYGESAIDAIPRLLEALGDEDEQVRAAAAWIFGYIGYDGQDAVTGLSKSLTDEFWHVRLNAALSLGKIAADTSESVPSLIALLDDEKVIVRRYAAKALGNMGIDAADAIGELKELWDSDPHIMVRREATLAAGKIGGSVGLVNLLKVDDNWLRASTAKAVSELENPSELLTALESILDDEDWATRLAAVSTILKMNHGHEKAMQLLTNALKDEDWEVCGYAASIVRGISPAMEAIIPELIDLLGNEFRYTRENASKALAAIGAVAVPALKQALKDENPNKLTFASYALGRIGPGAKEAIPELLELIRHENRDTCAAAGYALSEIGPDSVPGLIEVLETDDPRLLKTVVAVLGFIRHVDDKAVAPIIDACIRTEGEINLEACNALVAIGPDAVSPIIDGLKERKEGMQGLAVYTLPYLVPDSIPPLLELLEGDDEELASEAASILQQCSLGPAELMKDAVPDLIRLARIADTPSRGFVIEALGLIGPEPGVVRLMTELLEDPDIAVRRNAAEALGNCGKAAESAIPELIKLYDDEENYHFRDRIAGYLGDIGLAALPALVEGLHHEDNEIRVGVLYAIGELGSDASVTASEVIELLDDDEPRVRRAAVSTLGKIGADPDEAIPALIDAMSDTDQFVREEAVDSLMEYGASAKPVIPDIIEALGDTNSKVRSSAAHIFKKIGKDGIPHLEPLLGDENPDIRKQAVMALGYIGPDAAMLVPAIIEMLDDDNEGVRNYAAIALGKIGPADEVIPALVDALNDVEFNVRGGVIGAIETIGPEAAAAIPALLDLLDDETYREKDSVIRALGEIGVADPDVLRSLRESYGEYCREALEKIEGTWFYGYRWLRTPDDVFWVIGPFKTM